MRLLGLALTSAVLLLGALAWWLYAPMALRLSPGNTVVELEIEPGTSARNVAKVVAAAGVQVPEEWLYAWFRLSGQARQIRAGSYEIAPGTTPKRLLSMLVRGEESLKSLTLIEGWNFAQIRAALQKESFLKHDTQLLDAQDIMAALGKPGIHPEGQFFPDTYTYAKGSSELALLKRASRAMDKRLAIAWAGRAQDLVVQTPEQVLILASLVEKETGRAADRGLIAGVFVNRLRLGMLLQTDPSVIYGLGEHFDGNLRRRDLQQDTPYNTYTRAGLPPTPIAMPGKAALLAAAQPTPTSALYFVAKGDGSSHFSSSLAQHNQAVNRYIRGQSQP